MKFPTGNSEIPSTQFKWTALIDPEVYMYYFRHWMTRAAKMASGGVSVASLWTEVNRCGQNGDYTRALKALTKSRNACPITLLSNGTGAALVH